MIRLGTRASKLALWQANWAASTLRELGHEVELITLSTDGDVLQGPLSQLGGDGLFTKRLQLALLQNEIDLAVHSLKDLPTDPVQELCLAAVPDREDVRDAFVSNEFESLEQLSAGAKVGTGSLRRGAQLKHLRPDLEIQDLRGNVDTRLKKLDDGQYDAIILACAGLRRLELESRIKTAISLDTMLSAVGQGALGLETRKDDQSTIQAVSALNHADTLDCVTAERGFLNQTRAGCTAPVAANATIVDNQIALAGAILSSDGQQMIRESVVGARNEAETLGRQLAQKMMESGGQAMLESSTDSK